MGLPVEVKDPNTNTTKTTYDGLGRIKSVKYHGFPQPNIIYTYPTAPVSAPFAVKMEIWDEAASVYRSTWQIMDGLGRVIQTQSPHETPGNIILSDMKYDAVGLVLYKGFPRVLSNPGGVYYPPDWNSVPHTTTSYDALERIVSIAYPDGSLESLSYSGLRTTTIDRNSHQKVQENDEFGRLVKVEEYTGSNPYSLYATTMYQYDQRDLLKQVTDSVGNNTTIIYDGFGRKIEMTDPDLGNWHYQYDASGNLTAQIDAKRQAINLYYDDLNRLIGKTYNTGPVDPNSYQPPSNPGYTGYTVKYYYDSGTNGYGHRISMEDASGTASWIYNAMGRPINETRNLDNKVYNIGATFDAFGRPLTQTLPVTETTTEQLNYTYNAMGALSSLSGTNTYVSQIHYNASGQVTDQLLGNSLLQQSCYNANTLRLASLRAYSGTLQSCVTSNPSNARLDLSYSYQPNGNISQILDLTRNETLEYTYDELDRLKNGGGFENRAYAYDSIGNTTSKDNALPSPGTTGISSWWTLNEATGTRSDSQAINHLSDTNGVASTTGVKGNAASFVLGTSQYLNAPDSPSLRTGNVDFTICTWVSLSSKASTRPILSKWEASTNKREYYLAYSAPLDRFIFAVSADGVATSSTLSANSFGSPSLNTWYYVCAWHDAANDRLSIQVNNGITDSMAHTTGIYGGTAPFNIGRSGWATPIYLAGAVDEPMMYKRLLTSAERTWLYNNGLGRTYADLSLPPSTPTTYTYADALHKHAVTTLSTGESYTYDANGNMTCRVEGEITYKQEYNIENMLIAVSKMNGNCTTGTVLETTGFVYDGDGNLVKKINPDGSRTIYVGGIYEVDKSAGGTVTHTRVYYPAGGAMRIDGTLYYVLKDHLGSASVVTDASGNLVGEQRYYPFGETRFATGSLYTDKLFTGQREMADLGIYHYNARFYSPYINQFISADTIVPGHTNPQNLNRYSYVNNNPLRYNDPTGHMADYGGNEGGGGCNSITCFPTPPSNPPTGGGGGSGGGSNSGNSGNNGGTPTSTSTPCPQALNICLSTATNTPVSTNTPTPTSMPYGTPTPFGYDVVHNPHVQDFFFRSLPSLIPTDFGPDINAAWDSLLNGLPILGYPASSLSQAINGVVTGVTTVGTYVAHGATNAAINVSNTIGTTVNNVSSTLGNAMNTGFGGLGPIVPIFYVPTYSPLSPPPVYN